MNKVEIALPTQEWSTLKSKYAPDIKQVLVDEFTRGTINIDTQTKGAITKRKGGITYNPTALTLPFKDQYEAIFSDGVRHELAVQSGEIKYSSGDRIFNTIVNGTGFVAGSNFEFELTQDRVYGDNGVNDPIVYDRTAVYGGVTYTVPRIRPMGATVPSTAPTAGAPTAGGSVPNGAHTYKVTFVYYGTEESNGSASSGVQTAGAGNNTIPLTAIPIGGYGVTARRIYRDNNDGAYVQVGTISNNTATTFSDTVAAGTVPIPTDNGTPPVFGQLVLFLDRLFIADVPGNPSVIYFSEPAFPDIFPGLNFIICNQKDPIVALIVYQDRIIVFNRRSMGQILGTTSDTFRYSHIPGSVGCVDNRTIQTRTIDGVPVLVWLSDKGFYAYNGSSITYISEDIEDQVNANIQQGNYSQGRHTDDTQADFQAGVASPGIDLTTTPGIVTTRNPKVVFDDRTDWESGQSKLNIATRDGSNTLKAITRFAPLVTDGVNQGTIIASSLIKLNTSTSFFGEISTGLGASHTTFAFPRPWDIAIPIIPARSGTLTRIKHSMQVQTVCPFTIQTDSGGVPSGTSLGGGSIGSTTPPGPTLSNSSTVSIPLVGGVKYWIVVTRVSPPLGGTISALSGSALSGGGTLVRDANGAGNGSTGSYHAAPFTVASGYDFTYTPNAASGTWVSPIYDSFSVYQDGTGTISYSPFNIPNSSVTKVGTTIEYSDDGISFSTLTTIPPIAFQPQTFGMGQKRYWRLRVNLTTTDNVFTPSVSAPIFKFVENQVGAPAEWVSPTIETTVDATTYDSLVINSTLPAGTSIEVRIATSTNDISYPDGFVTFGTQVVRRYAKIRIRLVMDSLESISPIVSSLTFTWTIVANLVSASIDTGAAPPAGWGIFQTSDTLAGSLQYFMRSGASLVALAAASFVAVSPETLPSTSISPLQYTQWKVIVTSTADVVPTIDSVSINWLITGVTSVRAASIFVDRRYFCSIALLGSDINNIIFELDVSGKWRVHSGLEASTMGFFFNQPYYGSANLGKMYQFLQGFLDDESSNIAIDIRTKALDFSSKYGDNSSNLKTLQEIMLNGVGTGATYTIEFSVDNGLTFTPMVHDGGGTTFASVNNGVRFSERFRVNFAYGNVVSGTTIMIRITTNDAFDIEIHSLKIRAWITNMEL